jgi:hypothetical protein
MGISYGKEKFYSAMYTCMTDQHSFRERLLGAWTSGLYRLTDDDLPPDLRTRFEELKKAMVFEPAKGDEGRWQASIDRMTEGEIRQWLLEILSLFMAVVAFDAREDALHKS